MPLLSSTAVAAGHRRMATVSDTAGSAARVAVTRMVTRSDTTLVVSLPEAEMEA